jgi:hypothetical protein
MPGEELKQSVAGEHSMKEANKVATRGDSEATEVSEQLDESTRQVLDDYSRKFLSFIQQEKERIRKQALQESEKLLAEAEKKGRVAYDDAIQQASRDSAAVLARSKDQAKHVAAEADRLLQAVIELKEKTQRDIEEARTRLQEEADALVESIQQNNKVIAESRATLAREFDASTATIAQALQGLRSATKNTAPEAQATTQAVETTNTKASSEQATTKGASRQQDDNNKRQGDRSFVGTLNFDIEKGSAALYRRFKEALSRIPGLEISMADDSSKDKARIVAFASRPILLMNILHQMSLVRTATADKGTIEVVLQETDRWVG